MDFQEVLLQRHSCRTYLKQPVPHELLLQIADAGRMAPSGCNLQPWKFVIVDDAQKRQAIAKAVYDEKTKVNGFAAEIPAFIVIVHTPPSNISDLQRYLVGNCDETYLTGVDIGCAAMEMCLAATSLGLGSVIMGMVDQSVIRSALEIPESYGIPAVLGIGYPKKKPAHPRPRRSIDSVVCWNRFQ